MDLREARMGAESEDSSAKVLTKRIALQGWVEEEAEYRKYSGC